MTAPVGRQGRLAALMASGWFQATLTALLALVLAAVALRLWQADLAVPFAYDGDALQYLMLGKAINDHGWMVENGRLGAPFGQYMYDWAEGGWPSLVGVRLLDALVDDWVVAFNLFYLAGYALAALACLWGLRRLGVAPPIAIALSVLYALLPYHLDRGEDHYVLSLYFGLPPLLSYAVTTAAGRPALPSRRGTSRRRWLALSAGALLAAGLAGLMSAYYVAFAGLFMLAAAAYGWLRTRRRPVLVASFVICAVIGGTFVAQYAPVLAYRLQHGTNADVAQRYLGEVENYPLKPADLLLPVPGHPIGALAAARARYDTFRSPSQPGLALGALGSLGLLLALAGFASAAAAGRRAGDLSRRLAPIGWLAGVGLAIGVLGGGATLITIAIGPYLRAWDRIAIAIAFLALAALGAALTLLWRRAGRPWRGPALAGLATLVLVVGAVDQAATPAWVPPYAALAARWHNDAQLVAQAEALLPPGSAVYTMPYITFPETRRGALDSVDLLRGYLHSRDLRWSAGFLKGREPGWQVVQASAPLPARIELMRALGFGGLYVDRLGYPEPGEAQSADQLMAELGGLLGPPAAQSADGRLAFFLLGDQPPDARVARDALDPVWMRWASGFDLMYQRDSRITHHARGRAVVELRNDRPDNRRVLIRFELVPLGERPSMVEVQWPDGTAERLPLNGHALVHARELSVPAGRSEIRFIVPSAPPRGFAYTLADLAVVDGPLVHLLPELP